MTTRVARPGTHLRAIGPGVRTEVVGREAGHPLSTALLEFDGGAGWTVEAADDQVLLYCVAGAFRVEGDSDALGPGAALRVPASDSAQVRAEPSGARLLSVRCHPDCDEHAPLGPPASTAHVDLSALDPATSGREYQVLFDMHNGSGRATLFVGKVPPGAAPWHFHQYEEIVWILDGHGVYHLAAGDEEFEPGSVFSVRAREVHIVENAGTEPMLLLGAFTPAGSPAAAFLAPAPKAEDAGASYSAS